MTKEIQESMIVDPVQEFDGVQVDLSTNAQMFGRYINLIENHNHEDYDNQNYTTALKDLDKSELFTQLSEEEQQIMVDKITDDYSEGVKDSLRSEFPVIDQLVMEQNFKGE